MIKKNYAWPITAISKANYDLITSWAKNNRLLLNDRKLLIFGAGIRGAEIATILRTTGVSDITFTDNNKIKWGGTIDGHPIIPVEDAFDHRNMYVFLVSVEEGEGICRQLEDNGFVKDCDYFFPKPDFYGEFMDEYSKRMDKEILFLGDCMFEVVAFNDENKSSLTEILRNKINEDSKFLTMHGMSAPGFLHMIRGQINCNMIPRCIVMMLNFETLTGKQHLLPRSQHSHLIKSTCAITPDPDGKMKKYLELVEERVKNINAEFFTTDSFTGGRENNESGRISDKVAKMFFKLNYLYQLDIAMECIDCIKEIIRMGAEYSIEIVPFVPPVNYERGIELFGRGFFENRYMNNIKKLNSVIENEQCKLLDLSHICTKDEFAHITTPDETTNYSGRLRIADSIIKELESRNII